MGLNTQWPAGVQGAMLFTDAQNHVIFADRGLLTLMSQEAAAVIGKPFHEVLGVDVDAAQKLLESLAQNGSIRDWQLTIRRTPDTAISASCNGRAAHDEQGGFIGANIQLRDLGKTSNMQAAEEAKSRPEEASLQLYFTEHLLSLEVLVTRMLGARMRTRMEENLNKLASKQSWPIAISDGQVTISSPDLPIDVFQALLAEGASYAAGLVGSRLVIREMEIVDNTIDPEATRVANQYGLRAGSE